jgi:hypothetical protein
VYHSPCIFCSPASPEVSISPRSPTTCNTPRNQIDIAYSTLHQQSLHCIKPTTSLLHSAHPPAWSLGTEKDKPSHHPPSQSQIIHQHQSIQKRKPYVQRKVQQALKPQGPKKIPRLPEQHLREFAYPLIERFRQPIPSYTFRLGDYLLQRRSEEVILPTIVSEFWLCVCWFESFVSL